MNISFEGEKGKDLTERVISYLKEESVKEHNSIASAQSVTKDGGDITTAECETSAQVVYNELSTEEESAKEHNSIALAQSVTKDDSGDTTTIECETSAQVVCNELPKVAEYCLTSLAHDNATLRQENTQLRRDNDDLRERFNNCSYIVSDLNTKIKNIEDEKLSLVTALKLLQEDSKSVSLKSRDAIHNSWHTPGHKARANVHNTSANHACQIKTARSADTINQEQVIKMPNRFSLLSTDHDPDKDLEVNDEADLTESSTSTIRQRNLNSDPNKHDRKQRKKESQSTRTSAEIPKVKAKTNNRKNITNANSNDRKSGKLVFIAGDSILQHIHGWNLSNDD